MTGSAVESGAKGCVGTDSTVGTAPIVGVGDRVAATGSVGGGLDCPTGAKSGVGVGASQMEVGVGSAGDWQATSINITRHKAVHAFMTHLRQPNQAVRSVATTPL